MWVFLLYKTLCNKTCISINNVCNHSSYSSQHSNTENIFVVDADSNRWDRYLELTKCKVVSAEKAIKFMPPETLVLVANPNHLNEIKNFIGTRYNIVTANTFNGTNML
jgi:collagenase-like PrtC family protease